MIVYLNAVHLQHPWLVKGVVVSGISESDQWQLVATVLGGSWNPGDWLERDEHVIQGNILSMGTTPLSNMA